VPALSAHALFASVMDGTCTPLLVLPAVCAGSEAGTPAASRKKCKYVGAAVLAPCPAPPWRVRALPWWLEMCNGCLCPTGHVA